MQNFARKGKSMVKKRVVIGVAGPKKTPVGEAHHRAILTDDEVELLRTLYEDPDTQITCEALGKRFGVSKDYVYKIVTYQRRNTTPDAYKTIEVEINSDNELTGFREVDIET